MNIRRKEYINAGGQNIVYDYLHDSTFIIKIGSDIREHGYIFKRNSDIFPLVKKRTSRYLIIENLNTEKAASDIYAMILWFYRKYDITILPYTNLDLNDVEFHYSLCKNEMEQYESLFQELMYIIKTILDRKITTDFDFLPKNFGYTVTGKLKALDY